MARPIKKGLDYYPQDVDLFEDRKIKKLIKKYKADGFLIYEFIKSLCFKENGYWINVDDNLFFDISDNVPIDTTQDFVENVVNYCIELNLFDRKIYSDHRIITSSGIQKRYFSAKRTPVIVELIWVIAAETPVNAVKTNDVFKKSDESDIKESLVIAAETPVNATETKINTTKTSIKSTESTQSKVKESKEKNTYLLNKGAVSEKNERAPELNKNIEKKYNDSILNIEECMQYVFQSPDYLEGVYKLCVAYGLKDDKGNNNFDLLFAWAKCFNRHLTRTRVSHKKLSNWFVHFGNWLKTQPIEANPDELTQPLKQKEVKFVGNSIDKLQEFYNRPVIYPNVD